MVVSINQKEIGKCKFICVFYLIDYSNFLITKLVNEAFETKKWFFFVYFAKKMKTQ